MHAEAAGKVLRSFFRKLMDQRIDFDVARARLTPDLSFMMGKTLRSRVGSRDMGT